MAYLRKLVSCPVCHRPSYIDCMCTSTRVVEITFYSFSILCRDTGTVLPKMFNSLVSCLARMRFCLNCPWFRLWLKRLIQNRSFKHISGHRMKLSRISKCFGEISGNIENLFVSLFYHLPSRVKRLFIINVLFVFLLLWVSKQPLS